MSREISRLQDAIPPGWSGTQAIGAI